MKTLDYFKSYYVSIGGTGFNLKILPALAKVMSLVSHMKLRKTDVGAAGFSVPAY